MPLVLTVPRTDWSALIVMVPVPEAAVVTGGVSSLPLNTTATSFATTDPPKAATTAAANITAPILCVLTTILMSHPPCD
jgi:hypothetical protein